MEDEQVNPEGLETGPSASETDNSTSGDSVSGLPSLEEQFYKILSEHHYAINGMAGALMELKGRVDFLEDTIFGVEQKSE